TVSWTNPDPASCWIRRLTSPILASACAQQCRIQKCNHSRCANTSSDSLLIGQSSSCTAFARQRRVMRPRRLLGGRVTVVAVAPGGPRLAPRLTAPGLGTPRSLQLGRDFSSDQAQQAEPQGAALLSLLRFRCPACGALF